MPANASEQMLLCRVAAITCGLPLAQVIETLRPLPVEPLQGMPPFVAGLSVIRGRPVPVVLLSRVLGNEVELRAQRWVLVEVQGRRIALAVEQVIGVRSLAGAALAALPPLLAGANGESVSAIGALDAALLVVLEGGRILPDSAWALVPASGDAA